MKPALTYSAMNTFHNCPRKYKHRYIDHLKPKEKPESLALCRLTGPVSEHVRHSPYGHD